jgi:autotransporter-associated beta strand protein
VAQVISGTGPLTKQGAGNLTLGAINTYTNLTTVNGGTLTLAANAGGSGTLSGPLTINTGATVVAAIGNALGYAGAPWVRTINLNDGTLATAVAGVDNGWGLTVNFNGGSLTSLVAGGYFSMGLLPVVNVLATDHAAWIGANLTVRDTITFNVARGTAASDLIVNGNLLTASALGITKTGGGVLVLSGTNTYSGGTQINGGLLEVDLIADSGVSRIGTVGGTANYLSLINGTLRYTGSGTNSTTRSLWIDQPQTGSFFEVSQPAGLLVLAPATGSRLYPITKTGPGTLSMQGLLSGGASVTVADGTLTLGAANTYSGFTTVSNGLLRVDGWSGTGPVAIESGATLGGTGVVRGPVTQNGILSPGAGIGTLTVSNTITAEATSSTRIELGGTNELSGYDRLVASDVHTLDGTLEVVTTNGYVPASGDRFVIITNVGPGGLIFNSFATATLPVLPSGLGWDLQYNGTEYVSLTVTGTLGGTTPYDLWAASITNPALRGEQQDADGDGYANLFEYSQGSDATNAGDTAKLLLVRTNGLFFALFNRVNTATDIVYVVEGANLPTNGAVWSGIATNALGSWGASTNVNDNNTATIHRVWITDPILGTNRSLGINGFGRIGRLVFRAAMDHPSMEVVGINDLFDAKQLAYMLKYDTIHGRFNGTVETGDGCLIVNGKKIRLTAEKDPANLKWGDVGAEYICESTGFFLDEASAAGHIKARREEASSCPLLPRTTRRCSSWA